jgi:hypothetical protein
VGTLLAAAFGFLVPVRYTGKLYLVRELQGCGVDTSRLSETCLRELTDEAIRQCKEQCNFEGRSWRGAITQHIEQVAFLIGCRLSGDNAYLSALTWPTPFTEILSRHGLLPDAAKSAEPRKPASPDALYFKSNEGAFEYACKFMSHPLDRNASEQKLPFIGLVHGQTPDDSILLCLESYKPQLHYAVILAVEDGPIRIDKCGSILSEVIRHYGIDVPPPSAGDLVLVNASSYSPDRDPNDPLN